MPRLRATRFPNFFAGVENIILTIVQPQSIEPDAEMVSSVRSRTPSSTSSSRSIAPPAQRRSPYAPPGAGRLVPFLRGETNLPRTYRSAARSRAVRGADAAAPPSKDDYLQPLADGLDLVDAVKDIRTALHDQAKRALRTATRARLRTLGRPR